MHVPKNSLRHVPWNYFKIATYSYIFNYTITSYNILFHIYFKPATHHPLPFTRHPSPATLHPSPVTRYLPPATRHPSPATRHPPPVTRHPSPVTRGKVLPTVDRYIDRLWPLYRPLCRPISQSTLPTVNKIRFLSSCHWHFLSVPFSKDGRMGRF